MVVRTILDSQDNIKYKWGHTIQFFVGHSSERASGGQPDLAILQCVRKDFAASRTGRPVSALQMDREGEKR